MVRIKPFKALRPKKELCPSIVSLPYDVVTLEETKEILSKNPLSFLHIIRSDADFNKNIDPYTDKVYEMAKNNFNDFIKKEYLVQDEAHCFYVYRQKKGKIQQTGFIGTVSVLDYEEGIIKKHEKTRTDKENDRIQHIETLNAQTGFVFLTYRSKSSLNKIFEEVQADLPEIDFITDDKVSHTFWVIKDTEVINNIIEEFKNIPCLYIADGHHRTAAAAAVSKKHNLKNNYSREKESDYFLSIIYPHDNLQILAYNRAVKDLNGNNNEDFINKIKDNFIVEPINTNDSNNGYKPDSPKKIGMYFNGKWYLLKPKNFIVNNNDPVSLLDVSLLQDYILSPVLDIKDPKTDKRIDFIGGVKDTKILKEMVDSKEYAVAFSMYPTSIDQLMAVADDNKLMPPKSTWFEPKPRSGFATHLFSCF